MIGCHSAVTTVGCRTFVLISSCEVAVETFAAFCLRVLGKGLSPTETCVGNSAFSTAGLGTTLFSETEFDNCYFGSE